MKVSSAPVLSVETPSSGSAAKKGGEYGLGFESAIRSAEKHSDAHVRARDDKAAAGKDGEKAEAGTRDGMKAAAPKDPKPRLNTSLRAAQEPADAEAKEHEPSSEDAPALATQAPDDRSSAAALLGQLFGSSTGAAFDVASVPDAENPVAQERAAGRTMAAGKEMDALAGDAAAGAEMPETVLEERVVVVSLMPGATEASEAGEARGKVSLEVLHMETHFEPRTDAVVLVEGNSDGAVEETGAEASLALVAGSDPLAVARSGAREEATKLRLSFDEALARLGRAEPDLGARGEENATSGEGGGGSRQNGSGEGGPKTVASQRAESDASSRRSSGEVNAVVSVGRPADPVDDIRLPIAAMTDQVASKIIDSFGYATAATRAGETGTSESVLRFTAGGAALKTLTIQLQPENLGVLDVSMRLVDGQLTLELAASEASTAKVLAEDREGLRKLLQHAGFSLDETSITIVSREASSQVRIETSSSSAGAARQDFGSSQGGGGGQAAERNPGQPDARRDGGSRGEGQSGGDAQSQRRSPEERRATRTASASTYL